MKRFAACLSLLLGACGQSAGPQSGSHTHWLAACETDASCGSGLACRCGRCVAPCASPDGPCTAPVADTVCFAADSAAATDLCNGVAAPEPLCLTSCASDADCSGDRCGGGACLPPLGTGGTSGNGGGASAGTGAGGTGTLCGVEICADDEFCCGPSECGVCTNVLSGAQCPDTCPGTGGTGGAGGSCAAANYAVPDLDRTCTTASDCFLGAHWVDCCGSRLAVAFNAAQTAAFSAYEADCAPACACAESGPRAEDGAPLTMITDAVAECIDGQCLARAPEHAGTCLFAEVCIDTNSGGDCIAAPGPLEAGICRGAAGVCFYCECAAPDTPIATPDGERPIASLRVDDLVYSVEGEAVVVVPIVRTNQRHVENHRVVALTLDTGATLHISGGHPTADGRTFADLDRGDELDGQRVISARVVAYPHPFTYDILPATKTGTYFAGGALIGSTLTAQHDRRGGL